MTMFCTADAALSAMALAEALSAVAWREALSAALWNWSSWALSCSNLIALYADHAISFSFAFLLACTTAFKPFTNTSTGSALDFWCWERLLDLRPR